MTNQALWLKFQRRAATATPETAAEILRAWRIISASLSDAELARLIASGQIDRIIDQALLDRAFAPLHERIVDTVRKGFKATAAELPKAGLVDGVLGIQFNTLTPQVITAVRQLDSRVINTLQDDVREVVRAHVENGLRDGAGPATIGRQLRGYIGLSANQLQQVQNFRDALEGKNDRRVTDYTLRNKSVDRLLAKGPLTQEQVDRYVEQYNRKRIAQNAATNARTIALDSYKLGQKLSWQEARAKGVVPPGHELFKTWVQIDRPTKRESHIPMHGETVPFDSLYSNGDDIPGESEFNCGCVSRISIRRTAA